MEKKPFNRAYKLILVITIALMITACGEEVEGQSQNLSASGTGIWGSLVWGEDCWNNKCPKN